MSAVKLIFKRSSILGKRPTGENLEPGEIGLNTNPTEPGLYFEVNDGSVVKVGPAAYLPQQPNPTPSRGELWVDSDINTLSVGTDLNQWKKVAAPFLGGTNGYTVFVGPEYEFATDSLSNDGQSIPFVTINRAIIEITKQILRDTLAGSSLGNNRYLIVLAPGRHCVVNAPGVTPANFSYNLSLQTTQVTQEILSQFNPVVGGLILPRGVSIIGMDLKKCEIHPVYVPTYTHPDFPANYKQQTEGIYGVAGPTYVNQPASSIFKWSGNTYVSNFSGFDKVSKRTVIQIEKQENTGYALFRTSRPHGLNYNDFVQVSYLNTTDQAGSTFTAGAYYVKPVDSFTFIVSAISWASTSPSPSPSLSSDFSSNLLAPTNNKTGKLLVSNIYPYYCPPDLSSYELSNYSHHRISIFANASLAQLNEFYSKIQKAFPVLFGGKVSLGLASPPEYDIVAPTDGVYPNNTSTNSVDNSSPYENMVNHRSNYGMAHGDYDSRLVTGFKSVIVNSSTAVILQKDPVAYELYQTTTQNWSTLGLIIQSQPDYSSRDITQIPTGPQLSLLNAAKIPDIRYYYKPLTYAPDAGSPDVAYSIGLPDPDNDFRHFGFRSIGANSYLQSQSTYTIGAAIGVWAKEGGIVSLTNATTNFGSVAFQAEGFAGIGTLGGANDVNRNFLQTGMVRAQALTYSQVSSDSQKRTLTLGSPIQYVGIDPSNPEVQLLYLQGPFEPASVLPYSLKPGTAVFTTDGSCTYKAFFVTDGSRTCILSGNPSQNPYSNGGAVLRVRFSDSTIPNSINDPLISYSYLDIPYIRRFTDPRSDSEKSYGLNVSNSSPTSQAPQLGSVLRLNQTGQNLSDVLKRNFQFDPGQYGGYAQIFTVDLAQTSSYTNSGNFNNKISDPTQSTNYTIFLSITDSGGGWLESIYLPIQGLVPIDWPSGLYQTYRNKNYYLVENNIWSSVFYETLYTYTNGPTKVAPDAFDSPYVISSVLEKAEPIQDTWQGNYDLAPNILDPVYQYYVLNTDISGNAVPPEYSIANAPASYLTANPISYFRGSTVPYPQFGNQFTVDDDDGTETMGIVYHRYPGPPSAATVLLSNSVVTQTYQSMTTPWASPPSFGRQSLMTLELLSLKNVTNPRETVSILELTNPLINAREYVRVISIQGYKVTVIRNYYPIYYNPPEVYAVNSGWQYNPQPGTAPGAPPVDWPTGTLATPCYSTDYPEPIVYDPDWGLTKSAVYRYYQLLGFPLVQMQNFLIPQSIGRRLLLNSQLPLTPSGGYANVTAPYPVEFNNPSTILANTHTWMYCGYFDYSKGLPKYQVNEISRKLAYDFLSTTTFGGKLSITGSSETANFIFSGPVKEALTGNYYTNNTPLTNYSNKIQYQTPIEVPQPPPLLVYSVDDISGFFDGVTKTFPLTRGGFAVPISQLSVNGMFVFLGGVTQVPTAAYTLAESNRISIPFITFTEPPLAGTSCNIRVVTSEDNSSSVEVVNFSLDPTFDGVESIFDISPFEETLTDLNSFVFLGGVEQLPSGLGQANPAYTISSVGRVSTLSFIGGAPPTGTLLDFRAILSGQKYRKTLTNVLYVTSVDDISVFFDSVVTTFPLTVGNINVNPLVVNEQNMFVSLGGVMQIPNPVSGNPLSGNAYTVAYNTINQKTEITFAVAPQFGTTCNIRLVTGSQDQFIICPLPPGAGEETTLVAGPGVRVNDYGQIIDIDAGVIN